MYEEWAFNPLTTRFIVFTYPSGTVTWEMMRWLRLVPDECIEPCHRRYIPRARDHAMKELVLGAPAHYSHFVFIDNDIRPLPGRASAAWLFGKADVVAGTYDNGNVAAWSTPHEFHMGMVRFTRQVAQETQLAHGGWFLYDRDPDGIETGCECIPWARRVKEKGFSVLKAGHFRHNPKRAEPLEDLRFTVGDDSSRKTFTVSAEVFNQADRQAKALAAATGADQADTPTSPLPDLMPPPPDQET